MEPAPKSLILDLLSTLGRGAAPVRALVAAAELFAIGENSLRVALARLLADGLVERDERGLYRLGPRSEAVNEEVRAWRRVEERTAPWSGAWIGVHRGPRRAGGPRARRGCERALRFLGFRPFAPGLELRPDNLRGGVDDARRRLERLGLEAGGRVFGVSELSDDDDARARALWDEDALCEGYRATVRRLTESAERLPQLERAEAMRESFLLGGEAIRQIVLDPLLPEPIVPARERRALAAAIRRYDELGRRIWSGWLGASAEVPERLPADVRGIEAAAGVLRAAAGG